MKILHIYSHFLQRDLRLMYRHRAEMFQPLLFFVIVVALFPLAISSDPALLSSTASGILWMAALLATLLSFDHVFRSDYEDGSLEQLVLGTQPLSVIVFAKITSHWLCLSLPLIILSPFLGLLLHLTPHVILTLVISLVLGTPTLSLIGAIAAALTVGLRQGGVLLGLIVLPLYVPILIFGASAVNHTLVNQSAKSELFMLAAILVLALTLSPLATAGALKASVNNF